MAEIRFPKIEIEPADLERLERIVERFEAAANKLAGEPAQKQDKRVDMQDWQPIETAPKDQSKFLAWEEEDGEYVAYWFYGEFYNDGDMRYPTHWQPLPQPPKEAE